MALILLPALHASTAHAAGLKNAISNFEHHMLFLKGQDIKKEQRGEEESHWDGTVGVSYNFIESGGHGWLTPIVINDHLNNSIITDISFTSDGYGYVSPSNAHGLNDITCQISSDHKNWSLGAGITIPTGGQVGSSSARQAVLASYGKDINPSDWGLGFKGMITHYGDQQINASSTGQSGSLTATFKFSDATKDAAHDISIQISRNHRSGFSQSTQAIVSHDLQIEKHSITASVARGLTVGARDTTIEVDLGWKF